MENTEELIEESFKGRVVEHDYLICSGAFEGSKCQEVKAETNNYLYLLGVNTSLYVGYWIIKKILKK